jgi:ribonucleotide reductase beta subunit family protein with ferritin-like domain
VQAPEARCFYGFQIAMESIHQEMYAALLDSYVKDRREKDRLFNAHAQVSYSTSTSLRYKICYDVHDSTV